MIAVDTNIVLRLILDDHPAQSAAIESLAARDTLFVSLTVLLETGWVLESRYRLPRPEVIGALTSLIALDRIEVARRDLMDWAIDRYRAGADWADMVHVVAASKVGRFATLDRRLYRRAGADGPAEVELIA